MHGLYFAYGSNLSLERMRARAATASVVAPARLSGHRLTTDKRGRDGSGKANLRRDPGGQVWGVVYSLHPNEWHVLDACERGYARVRLEVITHRSRSLEVATYASTLLTPDPHPFEWYKQLMVEGARAQGLPAAWIERLEALPSKPDPR